MVLRIKNSNSSIYNLNKVGERRQPYFTPMLLRTLLKIPFKVCTQLENISYKVKIVTKPSSGTPKLLRHFMILC